MTSYLKKMFYQVKNNSVDDTNTEESVELIELDNGNMELNLDSIYYYYFKAGYDLAKQENDDSELFS